MQNLLVHFVEHIFFSFRFFKHFDVYRSGCHNERHATARLLLNCWYSISLELLLALRMAMPESIQRLVDLDLEVI
jgi:hypothetical protein